jgi:hypothetical protein
VKPTLKVAGWDLLEEEEDMAIILKPNDKY